MSFWNKVKNTIAGRDTVVPFDSLTGESQQVLVENAMEEFGMSQEEVMKGIQAYDGYVDIGGWKTREAGK